MPRIVEDVYYLGLSLPHPLLLLFLSSLFVNLCHHSSVDLSVKRVAKRSSFLPYHIGKSALLGDSRELVSSVRQKQTSPSSFLNASSFAYPPSDSQVTSES